MNTEGYCWICRRHAKSASAMSKDLGISKKDVAETEEYAQRVCEGGIGKVWICAVCGVLLKRFAYWSVIDDLTNCPDENAELFHKIVSSGLEDMNLVVKKNDWDPKV